MPPGPISLEKRHTVVEISSSSHRRAGSASLWGCSGISRCKRAEGKEGKEATEVLPRLSAIGLHSANQVDSEVSRSLKPFLVAREESEHPVVVDVGIQTCGCRNIQYV